MSPATATVALLSFLPLLSLATAYASRLNYTILSCSAPTFYSAKGSYAANLHLLLSALSTKIATAPSGFANSSSGTTNSATVYGNALCRGDVDVDVCTSCVSTAIGVLRANCSLRKEAVVWREWCTVRYANRNIFSAVEVVPNVTLHNIYNSSGDNWSQVLGATVDNITATAAAGGGGLGKKFAMKAVVYRPLLTLYSMAQCTPDLTTEECTQCLKVATESLPSQYIGGIMLLPSCNLRYEQYIFSDNFTVADNSLLEPPPPPPVADAGGSATHQGKSKGSTRVIVATAVAVTILVLLSGILICLLRRQRTKKKAGAPAAGTGIDISKADLLQFEFKTLQSSTQNFSSNNKIGEGGFGNVYKGVLGNGREIAVKRLSKVSDQGDDEFKNEAALVANLQHKNLVKLLGFCLTGEERILVYEYVPNHSLNHFLFDPIKKGQLDWQTRFKIIGGIARGMLYLHEDSRLRIIHRDLKPSNILLDETMSPKIADFGMSRIFGEDQTHDETQNVAGTRGYMAPEYLTKGQYSLKSDIYSFGVLVLEIISGKKNSTFHQTGIAEDLLRYAWESWRNGEPLLIVDSTLNVASSHSTTDEVKRCIQVGLLCIQKDAEQRPTMATIVHMLNVSSFEALPKPEQPDFFVCRIKQEPAERVIAKSDESAGVSVPSSINDASISELKPR